MRSFDTTRSKKSVFHAEDSHRMFWFFCAAATVLAQQRPKAVHWSGRLGVIQPRDAGERANSNEDMAAVRRTASGLLRLHHFYRAPAKVVVIRRNPLPAPEVDAFLPFGSRRDRQETFLVVVLYLGPLPRHAELAADFSKTLFHRVVQRLN